MRNPISKTSNILVQRLRKFLSVTIFLLLTDCLFAQYNMEWAFTFGGDGWDEANAVIETRDGEYLLAGSARVAEQQLWLVKVRRDGKGRWGKTYTNYYTSEGTCMLQTHDSLIVVAGYSIRKKAYQSEILVIKLDTLGNVLWEKNFGEDGDEQASCIIETSDYGYAIAGFSNSNMDAEPNWYILKIDSAGNKLWDKQFGSTKDDKATSIAETYDKGLVITGYSSATGGGFRTISVLKLDKDGNDEWIQSYRINDWDVGTAIMSTRDSNIVVAGYTRAYPIIDYDALIFKVNMNGDTLWQKVYGSGDWEEATDLIETYDNSYVLSGYSMSNSKDRSDFLIAKYSPKGDLMWDKIFKRKSQDYAKSIVETRDNGLLLAGTTFAHGMGWDYALLKMKNIERTDLYFLFPKDTISTTLDYKMEFSLCLKSFGTPNNVKVFVNDILQVDARDFNKKNAESDCDFPLTYMLNLTEGKNLVKFVVKDYKNYEFIKERVVYYLPSIEKTW